MLSVNAFNLDQSQMLSFGNELKVPQMENLSLIRVEMIVGKRDNAGYNSTQCFSKGFSPKLNKTLCCLIKG